MNLKSVLQFYFHHENIQFQTISFEFELFQVDDDFYFSIGFRHNIRLCIISENIENHHENGNVCEFEFVTLTKVHRMHFPCTYLHATPRPTYFETLHFLQQLKLTPGTQMRDMFTEVPFPLDFKIYVFNVTNKDEVNVGGKPKLQEIGPFYFELSVSHFAWAS